MERDPKEKALKLFSNEIYRVWEASRKLLEAWEELGAVDSDLAADVSKNYPFHKSFDELLLDLKEWADTIGHMAESGWFGPREWRPKRKRRTKD